MSSSMLSKSAQHREDTRKKESKVLAVLRSSWWDCKRVSYTTVCSALYTERAFRVIRRKSRGSKKTCRQE